MKQRTLRRLLCLGLLLAVIPSSALAALQVTFFYERMGTSALVQADGQTMLIDVGPAVGTDEILSYLDSIGLQKIDLLAGTLLREDHIGGMSSVLKKYNISSLWLPGSLAEDPVFQNLQSAIQASDAKVTIPMPGDRYNLGNAKISVLDFPKRSEGDLGTPGLVLRIDYDAFSFLIASDSNAVNKSVSVPYGTNYDVDVLAVNSYSSESLSQAHLDTVSPLWAVLGSDAELSPEETQTILIDQGIHALQPGKDRFIIFKTDGNTLQAEHAASGIATKNSINLRKGASTKSDKVATMSKGTVVTIHGTTLGSEGLWYSVEANGKTGFVRGDLIEEVSLEKAERLLAEATSKPRGSNKETQSESSVVETPEESPADCH